MQSPGYHLTLIPKGSLGQLSKIREEAMEAWDAAQQNATVMVMLELSDLVGAIQAFRTAHAIPVPSGEPPLSMGQGGTIAGVRAIADRLAATPPNDIQVPSALIRLEQEIHEYVRQAHPSFSWKDLQVMARITARAFTSGGRS